MLHRRRACRRLQDSVFWRAAWEAALKKLKACDVREHKRSGLSARDKLRLLSYAGCQCCRAQKIRKVYWCVRSIYLQGLCQRTRSCGCCPVLASSAVRRGKSAKSLHAIVDFTGIQHDLRWTCTASLVRRFMSMQILKWEAVPHQAPIGHSTLRVYGEIIASVISFKVVPSTSANKLSGSCCHAGSSACGAMLR